jgi:hypothetical protein
MPSGDPGSLVQPVDFFQPVPVEVADQRNSDVGSDLSGYAVV